MTSRKLISGVFYAFETTVQQSGGETIGRIVLKLGVCAKASTHKFHANGMAMTKTFCMTLTIRLLKTQSHEITLHWNPR